MINLDDYDEYEKNQLEEKFNYKPDINKIIKFKIKNLLVYCSKNYNFEDSFEGWSNDYTPTYIIDFLDLTKQKDIIEMYFVYQPRDYEGDGLAFLKNKENEYGTYSLGHCSCYGPFDTSETYLEDFKYNSIKECIEECNYINMNGSLKKRKREVNDYDYLIYKELETILYLKVTEKIIEKYKNKSVGIKVVLVK